jgi:hypothetical protein
MNDNTKMHAPHLFVLGAGAIGDTISAIPAMKYAYENIFGNMMKVMIPRELRDLFYFLPEDCFFYIGVENQIVTPDTVIIRQYDKIPNTLHPSAIISPMRMSLVDYNSIKFLGMVLQEKDKNYPTPVLNHINIDKFELPEPYACILVTNLNPNRSIPFDESYKIADMLLRRGINPVFLGKNTEIHDTYNNMNRKGVSPEGRSGTIDLVGKTSLMEAACIMAGAEVVVGADTGLIHLAACTDVKIVCGYTTVAPELRIPVRHNRTGWNFKAFAPPRNNCRFCASDWHRYDINFNECHKTTMECVYNSLTADNFIKGIDQLIMTDEVELS